ncbi:MAG: universal stress protein [Pseudomonadales bacterium]|nr:universal stress protein [Pseudomonadales bacterium]
MAKILVVLDPIQNEQTALIRCKEIADVTDIDVHVVLFIAYDEIPMDSSFLNSKREWLAKVVEKLGDIKGNVTSAVVPFERLYEEIIKTARKEKADFIFKPIRRHSILQRLFYTSTDWNLIRLCPVPLLLVSSGQSVAGNPVIAAVDVCTEDEEHIELNRIVMSQAQIVARVLGSKLLVANAFSVPASVMAGGGQKERMSYEVARAKHVDHLEQSKSLAHEFGLTDDEAIFVREGTPSAVVNALAAEKQAAAIVIGTVARSGLQGLIIGNTAEAVLENSKTDVLVVKQADFHSPI